MTISNLMEMTKNLPKGYKTLLKKEKLLVTSTFSFSQCVFKRLILQAHKNKGLLGKGLKKIISTYQIEHIQDHAKFTGVLIYTVHKEILQRWVGHSGIGQMLKWNHRNLCYVCNKLTVGANKGWHIQKQQSQTGIHLKIDYITVESR